MRSSRRQRPPRSDQEILSNVDSMRLLYAIADGCVVRGRGGETAFNSPYLLDGASVRLEVMLLAREDLVDAPISGPPRLSPRGQAVLDLAGGTD